MSAGATTPDPPAVAEPATSPRRWNIILIVGLIVLAALVAYHNCFSVPLLLDDPSSIEENPSIVHLWAIEKVWWPPPHSFVGGRPVVNLSYAVDYALGGSNVRGYHAFNLAVHVLATLTLYGIVRRTLLRPLLRQQFGAAAEWAALAVALIWMVHPLQTEAVTYISQRCESLMALFYLLTLYAFIRGAEPRGSTAWFTLSMIACYLGMACKEVMITAPVMVLLYDAIFVSGNFRHAWTRHRALYLGLAASWLLLGCLMVGLHNRGIGYGLGIAWWGYALTECHAVVLYLRLALWPHPLNFDYGGYVPMGLAAAAPYALVLAILATAVLFALRRQPALGFVGAWFLVILAPTSSVVPITGSPLAEHRMYLPLAAVVVLAVLAAVAIGRRLLTGKQRVVCACLAGGFVFGLFTFLTIQRNRDYRSALSIWQDTMHKCPNNPRARYNLGVLLVQLGRLQEGLDQYDQVLRIKPDYAEVHYNIGAALVQAGRMEEAILHYRQALQIKPDLENAHNNLGISLVQEDRLPEAIQHYEQALRIKPDFAAAHYNLALALMRLGNVREAAGHYEQALRIKPDFAEAHNNLGNALLQAGMPTEAISQYEQAVRIKLDYAEAYNNLGLALAQLGKLTEAIPHWEQALRVNPDYADAHFNLGVALEQLGRLQEAVPHYEQALRIKPDLVQAQNALARVRAAVP